MIISRAPLRISFVGGGTDLKDFYSRYPGRVISTTIDKYIYIVLNPKVLTDQFILKYQVTEIVSHPGELKHERFREALLDMNLAGKPLEISSIADLPAKTGLGSSSSFSVALMKALYAYSGKPISKAEAAEAASRLEIDILKEPIGKQDQYAAAFGGFNMIQFNPDGTVVVEPVYLDFKIRAELEDHLLLFFTGITRESSSVLGEQQKKIAENFETYKKMSDSVLEFREKLMAGNFKALAEMLHEGWLRKKTLASNVSNSTIDVFYQSALDSGAWGGKVLGAGGGGCLLFLAPPEKHADITVRMRQQAEKFGLTEFRKIPVSFSQSGVDILFNS